MIIVYLIFRLLVSDGFNLATNILQGKYCNMQSQIDCTRDPWNYLSTVNLKGEEKYLFIQDILDLVVVVFSIVFFFCYRKMQYHMAKVLDATRQTEDDFTILISNIPLIDFPTKKEGKKMRSNSETMQLYHREHIWSFLQLKVQAWLDTQSHWKE